ncbi:MAG: DUF4351 domain-containing protein [Chloracidobacterium sp.]
MTDAAHHNAYDQAFKYLADTDPHALLTLFGALPVNVPATITPLARELITSTRIPDAIYLIESGGERWIAHIEVQTRYDPEIPQRLLDYADRLRIAHNNLPVQAFLVLLTARGVPDPIPTEGVLALGRLRMSFGYTVVKLWELAADAVLAMGQTALLPLVPLMRGERSVLAKAAERLQSVTDEGQQQELQLHFLVLGGLRYDIEELIGVLGGTAMIRLEQLRESSVYQMILQEGRAEGLVQGFERGLEQGLERGLEQGLERGLEQGLERGLEQGLEQGFERGLEHERLLMTRLLQRKFGVLPSDVAARVQMLGREALERLADDLFDLPDADALAAWLNRAE